MTTLNDFYRKNEAEFYIDPVQFHLMSDKELAKIIADGIVLYDDLFPDDSINPLLIVAIIVICVVAVAVVAAAGAAAAGGGAAAASGGAAAAGATTTGVAAAAPGVTAVATSTGASTASVMSTVQSVAGYVSTAGKIYQAKTGKKPPDKLMAAADVVGSGSTTGAIESAVGYQLKQEGLKIKDGDKNAKNALNVMVQREQEKYSATLRKVAEQESKRLNVPISPPSEPLSFRDVLPVAVPIALFLLNKG
jgi:hypothetical protein